MARSTAGRAHPVLPVQMARSTAGRAHPVLPVQMALSLTNETRTIGSRLVGLTTLYPQSVLTVQMALSMAHPVPTVCTHSPNDTESEYDPPCTHSRYSQSKWHGVWGDTGPPCTQSKWHRVWPNLYPVYINDACCVLSADLLDLRSSTRTRTWLSSIIRIPSRPRPKDLEGLRKWSAMNTRTDNISAHPLLLRESCYIPPGSQRRDRVHHPSLSMTTTPATDSRMPYQNLGLTETCILLFTLPSVILNMSVGL